jgi:hypothetical protein
MTKPILNLANECPHKMLSEDEQHWIIEARGCGSRDPMRVAYFLSILGELFQRMN